MRTNKHATLIKRWETATYRKAYLIRDERKTNLQFTQVRLLFNDFPLCFRFYQDVMGFKATYGEENDLSADFEAGPVAIALFGREAMTEVIGAADKPTTIDRQDVLCLVFEVGDVDAEFAEFVEKGVNIAALPADHPDWDIQIAHLCDSDGNLIEISQSRLLKANHLIEY